MILKWFWHNLHLVLTSAALSWAGHAVAARRAVAFPVDAVALVVLFFDPAGHFSERNGGALASGEKTVSVCGADYWWPNRLIIDAVVQSG